MNYNQNWNNPQQQYQQQPPRVPQPPRNNTKAIIIICVVAALFLGGLLYFVAFVGRTMGSVIGTTSEKVNDLLHTPIDPTNSIPYSILQEKINSDSTMPADLKIHLTGNINALRKNMNETRELIKLYEDGFSDTLPDKRKFSSFDKNWAHAYFISSGRSANLQESLSTLQDQALNNLPDSTQRSRFENIIDKPSADWDNDHFNQSSDIVNVNLRSIRAQIYSFEKSVLELYSDYIDTY